ncbi:MAG: DegT/DnrJ/EryC1/StrS family aminotransferase [Deltaproteobacteria bacterium]|jgi:dTDP-4-amino-4,6-dideoxygalactose transaminase|nr:DegT/DnrJ/EryC1/StrS family aminotransferase [Deltaproteobacteria bacterium]MBW2651476.1 DegT/DnrJ/EryC1/StrS family aminotransferase [Deltaproteobacteria bacterium]
MRKDFLIFGSPNIEQEEIDEVVDSLKSGWISTGPKVAKFEALFKDYIGSKHALALNSCTAGLHLSMIVAGLKPGDEVITTPMTFGATGNSIIHSGAKPVFVDISLPTMNIDPCKIEEKITPKTKAILPVHFAGRPCNMKIIKEVAQKHQLTIIEDAAHAIEATYHGQKIGTIGDLTVFSFYVTKNLVTGEGGMITTDNDTYAEKIQTYALHGMSRGAWKRYSDEGFKHYGIVYPGFKYNMMDIQASLGIHQLKRIENYYKLRKEIWQRYDEAFFNLPLDTPPPPEENTRHAYHLYTILLRLEELNTDRDTIQQALFEENIGTGIHFISLHLHPYYQKTFGFKKDDFPNAAYVSERTISLPFSSKLSDEDVDDVIKAVTKVFKKYKK